MRFLSTPDPFSCGVHDTHDLFSCGVHNTHDLFLCGVHMTHMIPFLVGAHFNLMVRALSPCSMCFVILGFLNGGLAVTQGRNLVHINSLGFVMETGSGREKIVLWEYFAAFCVWNP